MNRGYGHDVTPGWETLAEAERDDEGLIHFRTVLAATDDTQENS